MLVYLEETSNEYWAEKQMKNFLCCLACERKVETCERKINFPTERHDIFVSLGRLFLLSSLMMLKH
jgi:hypothetical protein